MQMVRENIMNFGKNSASNLFYDSICNETLSSPPPPTNTAIALTSPAQTQQLMSPPLPSCESNTTL